jgi:hypothetical protein
MYKAQPVYHSGLAVVQLSRLPNNQFDYLSRLIPASELLHISIDGEDKELCVPYEDYEHCYQLFHSSNFETYFDSQL